jgi:hypothetical protein
MSHDEPSEITASLSKKPLQPAGVHWGYSLSAILAGFYSPLS